MVSIPLVPVDTMISSNVRIARDLAVDRLKKTLRTLAQPRMHMLNAFRNRKPANDRPRIIALWTHCWNLKIRISENFLKTSKGFIVLDSHSLGDPCSQLGPGRTVRMCTIDFERRQAINEHKDTPGEKV